VALDRADEMVIGGVASPASVGTYYIAGQVAPMPTREIAWPVERALMPALSRVAGDPAQVRKAVLDVMGLLGTVCIGAGVGILCVAEDLVLTVFGDQWAAAVPFFKWLALFGIFAALARPFMALFYALGRERLYAGLSAAQVIVTLPVVIYAAYRMDLVAVAAGRTAVAAVFFAVFCVAATRVSALRLGDFAAVLWRPALAAGVMAFALNALDASALPGHLLPMIYATLVGGVVFAVSQIALWIAVGKPEGPESQILARLRGLTPWRFRQV